jgi:hypothetical protein
MRTTYDWTRALADMHAQQLRLCPFLSLSLTLLMIQPSMVSYRRSIRLSLTGVCRRIHRFSGDEIMTMKKMVKTTINPIKILTTALFCSQQMASGIGGRVGENSAGGDNAGSMGTIPSPDSIVALTLISSFFVQLSWTVVFRLLKIE